MSNRPQKLTDQQVSDIRARLARGEKQCAIAHEYSVSEAMISLIKSGRRRARKGE